MNGKNATFHLRMHTISLNGKIRSTYCSRYVPAPKAANIQSRVAIPTTIAIHGVQKIKIGSSRANGPIHIR